ncbi:Mitogen-activated protein kinase 16-like protein, partial [Drosera capensis]
SAVDQFKKQFAYLEEHYKNGSTGAPPERQHASLPRACVLYSDNAVLNSEEVIVDLSKCQIKDVEQSSNAIPMTRLPMQTQSVQGSAATAAVRPGKIVSSMLHYNGGAAAASKAHDHRRVGMPSQYAASVYPKRNPPNKNDRGDEEANEGSNVLQPKPQYLARKIAAAQGATGNQWY